MAEDRPEEPTAEPEELATRPEPATRTEPEPEELTTEPAPEAPGTVSPPTPSVSSPRAGLRLRRRVVAVAVLVAVVVGAGTLLSRSVGVRAAPAGSVPTGAGAVNGAMFCPHGGAPGASGWVAITNPGTSHVTVRLSTFDAKGTVAPAVTFVVPPGHQVERPVPADDPADATEVEYFGGWVGASAIVQTKATHPALAAEGCVRAAHPSWFVPDASTAQGDTSYLVVMNPFGQDATFDVVLRTDQRTVRPGALSPFVLRGGTSAALKLNDFVLQNPAERDVTVQVTTHLGRVVVGGLVSSATDLREEAGISNPATLAVIPATAYVGSSQLDILNPGTGRADLSVVAQGGTRQNLLSGNQGISMGPQAVRTFSVMLATTAGTVVQSTNGAKLAVARRVSGPNGDSAAIDAPAQPLRQWLVMATSPPDGGTSYLVLQNPGQVDTLATVRLIGSNGDVGSPFTVTVPSGTMVGLGLLDRVGNDPVSALVSAQRATLVASGASVSRDGAGFAATMGLPLAARDQP